MDARPAPGPAAQPPVPAELTAPGWNGDVLRAGVALLAIDLLMVAATTEDRTAARSLVLEELGGCGVLERSALCEVLRRMTSEQALLAAWLDLPADAPPSADAAVPWLLAALAADSALQRRADSRARRAEHRDAAAQVVADGLRVLAPALVDLSVLAAWLTVAEEWARDHSRWPLDELTWQDDADDIGSLEWGDCEWGGNRV
ncbi:MAG TPA: hypothetical protein VK053_13245 [Jiangellaceae bacterium]|nr:hypothetical protein [Jiangellaceae bacterium]HLV03645.1 hypothetical protein [Actinomycetaceae bacterium]